jgi:rhodanese-related sulfurtransferase
MAGPDDKRLTVDDLLAQARARIDRLEPAEAAASGAQLIDIRSSEQRTADGEIPGALWFPRNVLEWRVDPTSEAYDDRVAGFDEEIVIFCDAGYSSSFAAATLRDLGFHRAADMTGGYQAWRAAGLPVSAPRD